MSRAKYACFLFLGTSIEKPKTFAPSQFKVKASQLPLKPECPEITTFLSL
jgi:hypothetical protein